MEETGRDELQGLALELDARISEMPTVRDGMHLPPG